MTASCNTHQPRPPIPSSGQQEGRGSPGAPTRRSRTPASGGGATHLFCGLCFNCIRGQTAACLQVRLGSVGAAYGSAGMSPYRRAQAELLRGAGAAPSTRSASRRATAPTPPPSGGPRWSRTCFVWSTRPAGSASPGSTPSGTSLRRRKPARTGPSGSSGRACSTRGVSVRFGRAHDRRYTTRLRDLVVAGRARPGRIVTHHGRLEDPPGLHQRFDRRADGVIKAVLRPA
jgi:threonine dehydrogenase-like Zn-dependent dehydrogenase